ncbi:MAG: hypothetical protein ABSD38_38490 [Syntrophorhabdales bacterium]
MGGRSKTRFVGASTGRIQRKAFLQITKALILGMRNSLTVEASASIGPTPRR